MTTIPRVLSIAGTDPTGGAGIQADLKSIGALGGYGMAVVTALVAQNTRGVRSLHVPDPAFLREQLESVSDDVEIDAVKLGMLHSAPVIETVADWLEHAAPRLVVLDPVMVATSGDRLLDAAAVTALRSLCRRVQLVTPNLPELAILVDETEAADWGEALVQARRLAREARVTVLLKGGHLHGSACPDAIVTENTTTEIPGTRISSSNTHGTGCSLSAAMATLAAGGLSWADALRRAKAWLAGAIANGSSLDVGGGNGPIDHFHELRPYLDSPRDARQGADPATADPVPAPAEQSWTSDRWAANAGVQRAIEECDFVRGLADGTLPRDAFLGYLEQDALYLRDYARVLASAAVLAPTSAEQEFWASGAQGAIAEETNLHRTRVGDTDAGPRAVTTAYLDLLLATSARGEYAVIAAAVLPCYRVYTELGSVFGRDIAASHPYGDWLTTYADPAFRIATERAIAITDRAAREASPAVRERMARAFDAAMRHELAFFCDPLNVPVAV